jgi:hypothetical protein
MCFYALVFGLHVRVHTIAVINRSMNSPFPPHGDIARSKNRLVVVVPFQCVKGVSYHDAAATRRMFLDM